MRISPIACAALLSTAAAQQAEFVGPAKYLNGARAAVTHTIDDSTRFVPAAIDAMDKYGIKATIYVSTKREPISQLWPRLQQAIDNGHEIGSHSRTHQCKWPDDEQFCSAAYSESEIRGSRDDILANTRQPYVWSWCYPCGNCASQKPIQDRLAAAGYLVARNYPDEAKGGCLVPDLQTWATEPLNAAFTQSVQKKGGIAPAGRTDVPELNAKFDEVFGNGGIYHFLSHPQWLDYGPDAFYEQHMKHIGGREEIWYVPLGPLYAYQTLTKSVTVTGKGRRFRIATALDPKIYNGSVTLEFKIAARRVHPRFNGAPLPLREPAPLDRWTGAYYRTAAGRVFVTVPPNGTLEFR